MISALLLLIILGIIFFIKGERETPTGYFSLIDIAPRGFTVEQVEDISPGAAFLALEQAGKEIEEMKEHNLSTAFGEDVLVEANQYYDEGDYLGVFNMTQLISYIKEIKIDFQYNVRLSETKIEEMEREKIDTSEGHILIEQAIDAFNQDQLDEAQLLLNEAIIELEKAKAEKIRIRGLALLSKNFIIRYWWQILIVLVAAGIATLLTVKKILKKRIERKLAGLKVELQKTKELIGKLQKVCFIEKKMTVKAYKSEVVKSEKRIAEIKHTIPILEERLQGKKAKPQTHTYLISAFLLVIALFLVFFMGVRTNNLTGYFTLVDIAPEGFTFEQPEETSPESALLALEQAGKEIREIKEHNLSTTFVEDALFEADQSYKEGDYLSVFKLAQLITYIKKSDIELLDRIELIKRKERELEKEGVNIEDGHALIEQAIDAFNQDQLDEAQLLLSEAIIELEKAKKEQLRIRELTYLSKNFIIRHWWQILIVLVVVGIATLLTVKKKLKKRIERKLEGLKVELQKTKEVIGELQKARFIEKTITKKTYDSKVLGHEDRIAKIKQTIPVLEAQLKGKKVLPEKEKEKGVLEVKK